MMTRRAWRTVAAVLLAAVVAGAGTTAAAAAQGDGHQARYCRTVDAYRIQSCARAVLPATPEGRQLGWVLAQLGGEAVSLTEAEVRQHVSAEFLTVVMPAQEAIGALQATLAEQGELDFVGFSYPPRQREALAIMENAAGHRGAVGIGVTAGQPALIEALGAEEAPPTIVPTGSSSGWFDIGERRLFLRCSGHKSPTVVFEGGLSMLKPLLPSEVWEALRQDAMAVPQRLIDPEQVDIWTSERQTRLALRRSPLRPMPLVALAHGRPTPAPPGWPVDEDEQLWRQLQRELAQLVPGRRLVVATESGHDIQLEQPELVLEALGDVVRAVRANLHLR